MRLYQLLLSWKLPPPVAIAASAAIYAALLLCVVLFWFHPAPPFRYIEI